MRLALAALVLIHSVLVLAGSTLLVCARITEGIRLAGIVDPFSLEIRLDQVESLIQFYRQKHDPLFLEEALLLSKQTQRLFPRNAQAASVLGAVRVWATVHGVFVARGFALGSALAAMDLDPISPVAVTFR